ncbi:MAG: DUF2335 domain-containing protein [Candidatus Kerfeldbacteria bacterium]|nr:DUF2335 domain-containing protein [Candidatus Kerfeldbacteria bacterium]
MEEKNQLQDQSKSPTTNNTHQLIAVQHSFSGPIPPPDVLNDYERIEKGLASRIVNMAEKQSGHRQNIESRYIRSANLRSIRWVVCRGIFSHSGKQCHGDIIFFRAIGNNYSRFFK